MGSRRGGRERGFAWRWRTRTGRPSKLLCCLSIGGEGDGGRERKQYFSSERSENTSQSKNKFADDEKWKSLPSSSILSLIEMSLSPSSRGGGGYCFTVRNRNTYYSLFNRELITREWSRKHRIGVIREQAASPPPPFGSHVTKRASSSSHRLVPYGCPWFGMSRRATPVTILLYSTPYKKTSRARATAGLGGREGWRRSAAPQWSYGRSSSSSSSSLTLTLLLLSYTTSIGHALYRLAVAGAS